MDQNEKINQLEKELITHEVQCEERWKTCFQRLNDVEDALNRIEGRMMGIGGAIILFMSGVIVALVTGNSAGM